MWEEAVITYIKVLSQHLPGGTEENDEIELHDVYKSLGIVIIVSSRRLEGTGHTILKGDTRNMYKISVRKLLGERPLGKQKRWVDNIERQAMRF